jgi:predicted RecA/RadA family phage recombinase
MRGYIGPDDIINLVAPAGGVKADVPVSMGGLIVVPIVDAAAGDTFAGRARGVIELPKAPAVALTLGQSANWLNSAGHVLGAAGDFVLGRVVRAAAASDTRVRVVLAGP